MGEVVGTMPEGERWMQAVAHAVHRDLERFFDEKAAVLKGLAPSAGMMLEEIRELTLRGGKRLRAVLVAAGYRAGKPEGELEVTAPVGAAMELLQSGLLIHDDWMDQDETRRGGPAVHASLRERLGDAHTGDSIGVLAGDYATSLSLERFAAAPFPPARREEALSAYLRILEEVYLGQFLDVTGDPDVSRMHRLKTTSYTVLGPLRLGAILGDVSQDALDALERWSIPTGEAFQVRDDLLGTLGDPKSTGKPCEDLRHGKRTALLAEAQASGSASLREKIAAVVGRCDASDDEVRDLIDALAREGVVARVEAKLDALVAEAHAIADAAPLPEVSKRDLRALAEKLGRRAA